MLQKLKTHFIPQNVAPKDAKRISLYHPNGHKLCTIPIGKLAQQKKEKLYSFGLMSDIHLWAYSPSWQSNDKFDKAMEIFQDLYQCSFAVHCGDLTQIGFYTETYKEGDQADVSTFAKYREICQKYSIPVYGLCGNHECYNRPMTETLDLLFKYVTETDETQGTAKLCYALAQGDDLFIFCGHPTGGEMMPSSDLSWLDETIGENQDKRCFVFVHSFLPNDSGNALNAQPNFISSSWSGTEQFMSILSKYPNVILFHGHSHLKLECQSLDKKANYTEINGFKSVHVPSVGRPRYIGPITNETVFDDSMSQMFVVDVYEDFIVLNGVSFYINKTPVGVKVTSADVMPIPLGTFKIDT